jgi:hypothetical protein
MEMRRSFSAGRQADGSIGDNVGTGDRMTEPSASLSRVDFDRLIARASKLDAGILLGMWELHVDPVVFAAVSWLGCAALGFTLDRLRRRAPALPPVPDTITA